MGVASPRAQGHATTITLIADIRAVTNRSSIDPDDSLNNETQHTNVIIESIMTHGANIDAIRSVFCAVGEREIRRGVTKGGRQGRRSGYFKENSPAWAWIGALFPWASSTRRTMRESTVAEPVAVTRMSITDI